MSTAPSSSPPAAISFPVAFEKAFSSVTNQQLKGKGTLTIFADGPRYRFQGRHRTIFGGSETTLEFSAEDIANVRVFADQIVFSPRAGSAARGDSFVFYGESAPQAEQIATLLPRRLDENFVAARDFYTRLHHLSGPVSGAGSVTNWIVALNCLAFVAMGFAGAGWLQTESLEPYIRFGANNGGVTTDGGWWRLLTSQFLHFGLLHLGFNMWALFQTGPFLEKLQGRLGFLLTYLGSGIIGGFTSLYWHRDQVWSAGASGAIFGVYGAILGYLIREKRSLPAVIYKPILKSSLLFAGYNLLFGLRAGVDNSCHAGGFLGGLALGWILALPIDADVRAQKNGKRLALAAALLGLVCVVGVAFAPRFDYRFAEKRLWLETNRAFVDGEDQRLNRLDKLASLPADREEQEIAWIRRDLIPFYENWRAKIQGLALTPGLATAAQRDALVHIFDLKIAAFDRLATELTRDRAAALKTFGEAEKAIDREIRGLTWE